MSEELPTYRMTENRWQNLLSRIRSSGDLLEDGAIVRVSHNEMTGSSEIDVYATALNKPPDWNYPLLECIPNCSHLGAMIGVIRYEAGSTRAEVIVPAAAEALKADYESGSNDMDYVEYEQAVDAAVQGSKTDHIWLAKEIDRLFQLAA